MNNENALENLVDTVNCIGMLEGLKRCFLIDGTLLGVIREGNFIAHDLDLDLGVYMEEWDISDFQDLEENMSDEDFTLHHTFGEWGRHFEASFKRDDIKIDLFFYYKADNKRRFNAFLNGGKTMPDDILTYEYEADLIENLKEIEWKGYKFMIPAEPEKVLVAKYGEDWKTPVTNWCWARDPKNLISEGKYL